jgi:hypothetical protein
MWQKHFFYDCLDNKRQAEYHKCKQIKKSINSIHFLKNGIPGFYSDSLIIRVPNFNLLCGCSPCQVWAASCRWWDSMLELTAKSTEGYWDRSLG